MTTSISMSEWDDIPTPPAKIARAEEQQILRWKKVIYSLHNSKNFYARFLENILICVIMPVAAIGYPLVTGTNETKGIIFAASFTLTTAYTIGTITCAYDSSESEPDPSGRIMFPFRMRWSAMSLWGSLYTMMATVTWWQATLEDKGLRDLYQFSSIPCITTSFLSIAFMLVLARHMARGYIPFRPLRDPYQD